MRWGVGEENNMVRVRRDRAGATVDSEGYPTVPTETQLVFPGTRDSVPYNVMVLLPEGERTAGVLLIITETELRAGKESTGDLPDRVLLDGETWEVRESQWYPRVIPHYEVRVQRIKTP